MLFESHLNSEQLVLAKGYMVNYLLNSHRDSGFFISFLNNDIFPP